VHCRENSRMIVQLQHIHKPQYCREKLLLPLGSASTKRTTSNGRHREGICESKDRLHKNGERHQMVSRTEKGSESKPTMMIAAALSPISTSSNEEKRQRNGIADNPNPGSSSPFSYFCKQNDIKWHHFQLNKKENS